MAKNFDSLVKIPLCKSATHKKTAHSGWQSRFLYILTNLYLQHRHGLSTNPFLATQQQRSIATTKMQVRGSVMTPPALMVCAHWLQCCRTGVHTTGHTTAHCFCSSGCILSTHQPSGAAVATQSSSSSMHNPHLDLPCLCPHRPQHAAASASAVRACGPQLQAAGAWWFGQQHSSQSPC